jgi:hypothetical protein
LPSDAREKPFQFGHVRVIAFRQQTSQQRRLAAKLHPRDQYVSLLRRYFQYFSDCPIDVDFGRAPHCVEPTEVSVKALRVHKWFDRHKNALSNCVALNANIDSRLASRPSKKSMSDHGHCWPNVHLV